MAHAEMLSEGVYGSLLAPQADAVLTLRQQLQQAFRLIDDLGEIWLGKTPLKAAAKDFCDGYQLCVSALEQNNALAQSRGLQVEIVAQPGQFCVASDKVKVERLIAGLLACGLHLVPKGTPIRLVSGLGSAEPFIGLLGDGISAPVPDNALLDIALEQLQRIKPIGLLLVQRWAQQIGARLIAHATSGGFPALGLLLPVERATSSCQDSPPDSVADHASISTCVPENFRPFTGDSLPLVLIADDQVALTTVVQTYLEDLGLRVLVAQDGYQAIQHTLSDRPRLIIMDVRMPMLDGLQALEQIRSSDNPVIASTPVICVSGYAAPGEQERCLKAGATAFLRKPFGVQHLLDLVKRFFPELGTANSHGSSF